MLQYRFELETPVCLGLRTSERKFLSSYMTGQLDDNLREGRRCFVGDGTPQYRRFRRRRGGVQDAKQGSNSNGKYLEISHNPSAPFISDCLGDSLDCHEWAGGAEMFFLDVGALE